MNDATIPRAKRPQTPPSIGSFFAEGRALVDERRHLTTRATAVLPQHADALGMPMQHEPRIETLDLPEVNVAMPTANVEPSLGELALGAHEGRGPETDAHFEAAGERIVRAELPLSVGRIEKKEIPEGARE